MRIDWNTTEIEEEEVFKSSLGNIPIKIGRLSVTIDLFRSRLDYEQITSEILNDNRFKDKLIYYDGVITYLVKK